MVDIHTHLLPGVDDGARNMEDTLEMARLAAEDGVKTIVATPHAYWENAVNAGPMIVSGVAEVNRALDDAGIAVRVLPGCEVPMRRNLMSLLEADPAWTIDGANAYLLLEPPWGPLPEYCFSIIQEMVDTGMTPIIAHPERSPDLQANPSLIERMVKLGALTQVTANSITGRHGGPAREIALRLLDAGMVHVVASDSHNAKNRAPVLSEARAEVTGMVGAETAHRLFEENPQQIVDSLPIAAVAPGEFADGAEKSQGMLGGLFRRIRRR